MLKIENILYKLSDIFIFCHFTYKLVTFYQAYSNVVLFLCLNAAMSILYTISIFFAFITYLKEKKETYKLETKNHSICIFREALMIHKKPY